ncbi:RDD family protein [Streptomyces sp. NPDC004838]
MSNDQPPPSGWGDPESGRPPENDPFKKQPPPGGGPGSGQEGGADQPPQGPGQGPPQGPPPGSPYGGGQGGPYGGQGGPYGGQGGQGGPYGGQGGPYGSGGGGMPPPYDPNAFGGGPYGGSPDPLAGMPPLADFGKRFAARVIDGLIIFVPLFLISLLAGGWDATANSGDIANQVNTGRQWLWSLIALIAYVGYDTIMVKKSGQTVGKRLLKIRIAMLNDGSTPGTNASLTRAAVLWVPALVCCFCLWWIVIAVTILFDKPYRQGLHDKAAKTVVVTVAQ